MQTNSVNRRQLLDILLSISGVPSEGRTIEPTLEFEPGTEISIFWRDNQDKPLVPGLIVVEKNKQRDFFAWVTAFVPTLRPFSAFFRVVDPNTAAILQDSDLRPLSPKLASGLVGLIVAEGAISKNGTRLGSRITARDCVGTAAFCLARALVVGLQSRMKDIIDDWGATRELIENRRPPFAAELRFVWGVVTALSNRKQRVDLTPEQEAILLCCRDILEDGDISPHNWNQITSGLRELENLKTLVDGTREDRVIMLERLLATVIRSSEPGQNTKAFICGYLTSLIAPGTLDHFGLLVQVNQSMPAAIMWYGLCAGLKGNGALYTYSGGVGRRVMRELTRRNIWTDAPTCDIAVGELVVLASGSRAIPEWLRNNGPFVEIELAPGVTCSMRITDSERDGIDVVKPIHPSELRRLYDRTEEISLLLGEAQKEITRLSGGQISNRRIKR